MTAVGHSRHSRHPGVSGSPQERTFGHCRCFVALQGLALPNLRLVRLKPSAVFSEVPNLSANGQPATSIFEGLGFQLLPGTGKRFIAARSLCLIERRAQFTKLVLGRL